MIGFLKGKVHSKFLGQITLLVGGVGYLVALTPSFFQKVQTEDSLEVFAYPHIKEDAFDLYGFKTQEEIDLFKLVMTVSGIGPKTALLVLDKGTSLVENAIRNADADFFTGIPRLGRKNAQKIIIELKNKLGGLKELDLSGESQENMKAIEGLRSMGYTKQEALKAISEVPKEITKLEEKISYALRQIGKNNG